MELTSSSAVLEFKPDPGWSWVGWDGKVSLTVAASPFSSDGNGIALSPDVELLALQLIGKAYKANGFDAIPGTCAIAKVVVNPSTLSRAATILNQKCVTAKTSGTFTASCVPSFGSGAPPPPDPVTVKTGTWSVSDPGQQSSSSDT